MARLLLEICCTKTCSTDTKGLPAWRQCGNMPGTVYTAHADIQDNGGPVDCIFEPTAVR